MYSAAGACQRSLKPVRLRTVRILDTCHRLPFLEPVDPPLDLRLPEPQHIARAYYEHMPLRRTSLPSFDQARIYRRLAWGRLAEFNVLDTRQYRSDSRAATGSRTAPSGSRQPRP